MSSETVFGGQVVRPAGPLPAATGRVCVIAGCTTQLSSYNRHNTCFRHTAVHYPRVRGRVDAATGPSPRDSTTWIL